MAEDAFGIGMLARIPNYITAMWLDPVGIRATAASTAAPSISILFRSING